MSLTIGISDYGKYWSLTERLLGEGHNIVMIEPTRLGLGLPRNLWAYIDEPNVTYVESVLDMVCVDYVIGCETDPDMHALGALGIPVLGHSPAATALEHNRRLAFSVVNNQVDTDLLTTPTQLEFAQPQDLLAFLATCDHDVVLKQSAASPAHVSDGRTVIGRLSDGFAAIKSAVGNDYNPFWIKGDSGFVGGALLEDFVWGQEVCFGRMFNGKRFVGPIYACQEHKDAQNGSRSGVLTGEVGTTMRWFSGAAAGKASLLFQQLEAVFARLNTKGMVDVNTILDVNGNLHLIEFTVRWGRPTMDLQVAAINLDMGHLLHDVVMGRDVPDNWTAHDYTLGVVVFDYGLPLKVEGRKSVPMLMPPAADGDEWTTSDVLPFLSLPPTSCGGPYMTAPHDGRHFTSIACGTGVLAVRQAAYAPLRGYSGCGFTWRDDIGATWSSLLTSVHTHGILTDAVVE